MRDDGEGEWRCPARSGGGAFGPADQTGAERPQCECAGVREAHRCGWRAGLLQLPGAGGKERRLMKTLGVFLLVTSLLVSGCKRRERKIRVQQTDEDTATLASMIHMGDPKVAPQLLKGFYNIEENAWRWTMGKFAVALRPPRNASI